ncbi:hypothetical protein [Aquimarina algicola]|uniref:DUF4468 domain-containing protein n=1 Tax=Aquimarina algicola TaxID=2589995 RepID=A0A504JBU8_9FLAO|nr:hypothetical protein [Aquimarina algicola]TPN86022.1 hypothetical protein FHK87_12150 [Aquimarina algicola]
MKKILLFLSLISSSLIFSQLPKSLLTPIEKTYTYDEYEGSIYMKGRYKESSVIDEKSGTYDTKLKYNILTDALEYTSNSELFEITKSAKIHARIDGDYFYYCNFETQRGMERDGYYILVELTDNYRIYKKYTLKITDPEPKKMVQAGTPEPGRLRTIITYLIEENGIIMELPMKKKDFLATFSDKEDELKQYLKKESIRFKKEEDLIRLVARYNALKNADATPSQSLLSNRGRNN